MNAYANAYASSISLYMRMHSYEPLTLTLSHKGRRFDFAHRPEPVEGGDSVNPPPLIGSTIRRFDLAHRPEPVEGQAHGAERSRSTSSLQVGGGEGEGDDVNLFNSFAIVFNQ